MTLAARDRGFARAMAAPGLAALLALTLLPLALTLAGSVLDHAPSGQRPDGFAGLRHYVAALGDAELRRALLATLAFAATAALVELALGLAVALALASVGRGGEVYRAVLLLPLALSPVAVGLLWRALADPSAGIAGARPVGWPGGADGAFWALLLLADAWQQVPFVAVLLTAGLAALPREVYEAARMEGAGAVGRFLHVTLPLLRPAIALTLLIRLVLAIRAFDLAHGLAGGGSAPAADLASRLAHRQAFAALDPGRACVAAVILVLLVLPLTAWLHRRMRPLVPAPA